MSYQTQSADTAPWAERLLVEHWRAMRPREKAALVRDLCRSVRELSIAGIRSRHPGADEQELRFREACLRLDPDLVRRIGVDRRNCRRSDPLELAGRVANLLAELEIPCSISGSIASSLHGEPRSISDVDVDLHLDAERVESFWRALALDFHVDPEGLEGEARPPNRFVAIERTTFLEVDFRPRPRTGVFADAIRRARAHPVGDPPAEFARVATPEDTVLEKLCSHRDRVGLADVQWRDALGVLKVVAQGLDREYLDRWARDLGVADSLDRALDESGLRTPG